MPIPSQELNKKFLDVNEHITISELYKKIKSSGDKYTFIIVQLESGNKSVILLSDIIESLKKWRDGFLYDDMYSSTLKDIPDLLNEFESQVVDQNDLSLSQLRDLVRETNSHRVVVKDQNNNIIGVYAEQSRSASDDVNWLDQPPIPAAVSKGGMGVLSAAEPDMEPEISEDLKPRFINIELFNGEEASLDPQTTPLKKEEVYYLQFDIDEKLRAGAIVRTGAEFKGQFAADQQMMKVTVRLESEDFEFYEGNEKVLLVPRLGKSKNKAKFMVVPNKDGKVNIKALFLKDDGTLIQIMEMNFYVGEIFTATTLGYDVNSAFSLPPRDLNLTILQIADGFQMIMTGSVGAMCKIPLTLPQLASYIEEARQALLEVVHMQIGGGHPNHQASIDISDEAKDEALKILSKAGYKLYDSIFFGPAADEQTRNLGEKLRQMAQGEKMQIKIFSQHFMLPWGILYMADRYNPYDINPELFLGLKHIIEHIPLQPAMTVINERIDAKSGLKVGLNVNKSIDEQMRFPLVAQQLDYWKEYERTAGVEVVVRESDADLVGALSSSETLDQIFYLYCHAISKNLEEKGGPGDSMLVMTGHKKVKLEDLQLAAPTRDKLPGNPLVFINACESAELSPMFYDGFVPYFMAKGARGVIGTECETPAIFGLDWSKRFFKEFLTGNPLGKVFLDLRREYFYDHNNIMGLLYALYVDGDTRIEGVKIS